MCSWARCHGSGKEEKLSMMPEMSWSGVVLCWPGMGTVLEGNSNLGFDPFSNWCNLGHILALCFSFLICKETSQPLSELLGRLNAKCWEEQ
jgi:hypothetical protein